MNIKIKREREREKKIRVGRREYAVLRAAP